MIQINALCETFVQVDVLPGPFKGVSIDVRAGEPSEAVAMPISLQAKS